jgi:toxin ParE1/3/4
MKIRWTRPALGDLEAIGDYVARDKPVAAAQLVEAIFAQVDLLARHPHVGRPGRIPGTRELVVTGSPYIVPYRVRNDEVEILAVFHGARRWPDAFG